MQARSGLPASTRRHGFISRAQPVRATIRALHSDIGDAEALPIASASFDVVVSGLVLNFVPDRLRALEEMKRTARPNGRVCFYVWDYPGGGVEFMSAFWTAATSLDPDAADLVGGPPLPFLRTIGIDGAGAGRRTGFDRLRGHRSARQCFATFDDFWRPFTLGRRPGSRATVRAWTPRSVRRFGGRCRSACLSVPTARSRSKSKPGQSAQQWCDCASQRVAGASEANRA